MELSIQMTLDQTPIANSEMLLAEYNDINIEMFLYQMDI